MKYLFKKIVLEYHGGPIDGLVVRVHPTVEAIQRRRGRPQATRDPSQRRRHIGLALIYFGSNWTLTHVAKMHDVGTDTARRWIRLALNYNEPEADRVRILAAKSQRKIKNFD